jgi:hypothetical protein
MAQSLAFAIYKRMTRGQSFPYAMPFSRGDKTPLELFIAGIASWDTGLRRRLEEGKPASE